MPSELILELVPPGATLQDSGRPGWLASGVPPSGPLDFVAHAAANLAAGNDPSAAALELPLGPLRVVAHGDCVVSIDGAPAVHLDDRASLFVPPVERAVQYLAVRGGFDVPPVLGSRSTLLVAGFGGYQGRPLRKGDRLIIGADGEGRSGDAVRLVHSAPPCAPADLAPADLAPADFASPPRLEVWPGPHLARFGEGALAHLLAAEWRVSPRSDRVGTRLEGDRIAWQGGGRAGDRTPPAPMVRGAMQITSDGTPIVFGPDHPVTGGYPVLAVLTQRAQAQLARLRPLCTVRFALTHKSK